MSDDELCLPANTVKGRIIVSCTRDLEFLPFERFVTFFLLVVPAED